MKEKKINLPDFHELEDRIIAEPSHSPTLVIKTNLDADSVTSENPYSQNDQTPSNEFKNFFKE